MRPPVQAAGVLPERRRALRSGQHVDQHRRHRHEHADRNDLQGPSLEPRRQAPWPQLEEREGSRRRQTEDDGAEEERGRRASPRRHQQEADADRHRQRDGHAACRFHDDAVARPASSGDPVICTPFTVSHTANDSSQNKRATAAAARHGSSSGRPVRRSLRSSGHPPSGRTGFARSARSSPGPIEKSQLIGRSATVAVAARGT